NGIPAVADLEGGIDRRCNRGQLEGRLHQIGGITDNRQITLERIAETAGGLALESGLGNKLSGGLLGLLLGQRRYDRILAFFYLEDVDAFGGLHRSAQFTLLQLESLFEYSRLSCQSCGRGIGSKQGNILYLEAELTGHQ